MGLGEYPVGYSKIWPLCTTGGYCMDHSWENWYLVGFVEINQIIINMCWKFPKKPCDTLCVNEIFILQNTLALEYWKKVISSQHWSPPTAHKKILTKNTQPRNGLPINNHWAPYDNNLSSLQSYPMRLTFGLYHLIR